MIQTKSTKKEIIDFNINTNTNTNTNIFYEIKIHQTFMYSLDNCITHREMCCKAYIRIWFGCENFDVDVCVDIRIDYVWNVNEHRLCHIVQDLMLVLISLFYEHFNFSMYCCILVTYNNITRYLSRYHSNVSKYVVSIFENLNP